MDDGRTHLALDVVADDRQSLLFKAASPAGLAGDEHRDAVDDRAACRQGLLHVPARGLFATDGQIIDQHVGVRLAQDGGDVDLRRI